MRNLKNTKNLIVKQVFEGFELFGFETRNKYQIITPEEEIVGYAAEESKGFLGLLGRQFLGHWRSFRVHFYDQDRNEIFVANHPFRFLFKRFEILDEKGAEIGALQQRFSIFSKKFDVLNKEGQVILEVSSPIWTPWTFPFFYRGEEIATVRKKWSGFLSEFLTDRDNFRVEFSSESLTEEERTLVLASSVFIDLIYFEKKANS